MAQDPKWEEVFATSDQVEAELVRGLLDTSGIPVVIEAKGLKAMPTYFGHAAYGELILKVPPDQVDLALALLAARPELPDEV